MIEITEEEFDRLQERDDFLSASEIAGVDNWDGYYEARLIQKEWYGEVDEDE